MQARTGSKSPTAYITSARRCPLQQWLVDNPDAGDLVRGGAGLRKVRWALPGGGKSGGIRVLYYWRANADKIYLLFLFGKRERSDLAPVQVRELAKYVKELK